MTTPGQIAVVLSMLTLVAGGSLIVWIYLFRKAAQAEKVPPPIPGLGGHTGDHV
ncbi:MAG: hypothetical protein WA751_09990 [Candidatus Dormiibacterota bacterium]